MSTPTHLLEARGILKRFPVRRSLFKPKEWKIAVDRISFGVPTGSTVALVGESGSGKSTVGLMLLNLLAPDAGEITFDGQSHQHRTSLEILKMRRQLQVVFQDPYSSLNGRMTVREALTEGMIIHKIGKSNSEREEMAIALLASVHLESDVMDRYPHEFSGGQRQRIAIARALSVNPKCIVLDEPTSALDASVQSHVLNLLRSLQQERGLTYLLITHNLDLVGYMADSVIVMRNGAIVEQGTVTEIFDNPKDEYTRALLGAAPKIANG